MRPQLDHQEFIQEPRTVLSCLSAPFLEMRETSQATQRNNPWCFIKAQYPGNPADVSYQCPVRTLHIRASYPLKHRTGKSSMMMPSKLEMSSVMYLIRTTNLATLNPYVASSDSPEDPPSSIAAFFFFFFFRTTCLFAQEDCHPNV